MSERDPLTRMTEAELIALAEEIERQGDDPDAWEDEEAPEISPQVRSVVSVRFNPGELGPIEQAANAAGVPVSTFIRNAAVSASSVVDVEQARRSVRTLREDLDKLATALGEEGRPARRRRRTATDRPTAA